MNARLFIEYFNHNHLVTHVFVDGDLAARCGEARASMLPARESDYHRATRRLARLFDAIAREPKTYLTLCGECWGDEGDVIVLDAETPVMPLAAA